MTPTGGFNDLYPVVIMQCRGVNPDREDCWSSQYADGGGDPIGLSSSFLPDQNLPVETSPWVTSRFANTTTGRTFATPFRTFDGKYRATQITPGRWFVPGLSQNAPDLPAVDDWTPSTQNMRRGRTGSDGKGQMVTWVNTAFENPSIGCSDKSPCSLVVVPIKNRVCRTADYVTPAMAANCQLSSTKDSRAKSAYWQLLGNWYERYVFKLSFAPRTTPCAQRDDAAGLTGSELAAEAMRSWAMVRCAPSSPAALDYTRKWEPESRQQLGAAVPTAISPSGYVADGVLTNEPAAADDPATTARKPGYAPVAISGFAIHYNWEKSGGEPVPDVKLNARLVAKMFTQSYSLDYRVGGAGNRPVNPNVANNPQTLSTDPEFRQLNPDSSTWGTSNSQLTIPSARTDVILALTRWLWSDPAARAFLQGKPDQWGMTVNKTYRGWALPRDDYELKDGWVVPAGGPVSEVGTQPQQNAAQTSNSWAEASDDIMIGWPRSQVMKKLDDAVPDSPWVAKRSDRQAVGARALVGLTVTSEVEKTGMRSALLQNSAGEFVAPNTESLYYALDGATVDTSSGAWRINHAAMDKRGYPGTMITYAAVPTTTLKGQSPKRYADTLRWIANEGQQYGPEPGQLPDGYLALTDPMKEQVAKVADAVENQTGTVPIPPDHQDPLPPPKDPTPDDPQTNNPDDPTNTPGQSQIQPPPGDTNTTAPSSDNGKTSNTPTTPGATPSAAGTKQPALATGSTKPVSAITKGESLGWLAWGIPALLMAGLLAGVASPGIRVIAQPDHPVRRGVIAGGNYLAGLARRGRRRNG
jgi:hypothetical protein